MRIFRRRRRRKFRLTREGKAFLFVTVGVGLAAVNTANTTCSSWFSRSVAQPPVGERCAPATLALWKLQIKRKLPTRLFAGRRSLMDVVLLNEKRWLSSVSVEVIDELEGAETASARFLRVAPR